MSKTNEELQEYIHQYKAATLTDINEETQKRFDQLNQVDLKLGNLLLTLGSAFIAIIGSYVLSRGPIDNRCAEIAITVIVLLFLVSIITGLKNYQDISLFWLSIGKYKHAEGKIIVDDQSKTYDDLVGLRAKLDTYRNKAPKKSKDFARAIQVMSFLGGIFLFLILMLAKIYR
jgi:hypothetical protein